MYIIIITWIFTHFSSTLDNVINDEIDVQLFFYGFDADLKIAITFAIIKASRNFPVPIYL